MKKCNAAILIGLAINCLGTDSAFAISPIDAYKAALQNDPNFRVAKAERDSGKQFEVIGRSTLLPQAQYSFSKTKNLGEMVSPDFSGKLKLSDLEYPSSNKNITVRQPLFNLDSYARFEQGRAQTKYSDAQFDARSLDLMVRLMAAYVEVKFAEDQVRLYAAQRDAYAEQMRLNSRTFEKGEGTKTDMLETQSKLDVADAMLLEAQDNLLNARNTLSSIVGSDVGQLDSMKQNISFKGLVDGDFASWQKLMEQNNPELKAAQLAVEIAEKEIAKARAGHAPRIDLNASYNHGRSETVNTQKQDINMRSVAVQLVIPIYSGGYVSAVSRQSVAQKEKAIAELDNVRNKLTVELRKNFNAIHTGEVKLMAMQNSVKSAEALVEATSQSIKAGVRINLDYLNAQQQLVVAKKDLAQTEYNLLLSYLKLKVGAGVASFEDMQTVSCFFVNN